MISTSQPPKYSGRSGQLVMEFWCLEGLSVIPDFLVFSGPGECSKGQKMAPLYGD